MSFKKVFNSIILVFFAIAFFSCSESTTEPTTSKKVYLYSLGDNSTISKIMVYGNNDIQSTGIDSLEISKVKILISNMMLHQYKKSEDDNKLQKEGPFVFIGDNNRFLLDSMILNKSDNYDKIKFEIHRFNTSELDNYSNDTLFKQFATTDRYSVVIKGTYYMDGYGYNFTYQSDVTANITINTSLSPNASTSNKYFIWLDAASVFKSGGEIYNPTNEGYRPYIDNAIKNAFKCSWGW